jgi:uncharacterized membrane protein
MNSKRPLSVTIIAILYLAVGIAGFVGHGYEAVRVKPFPADAIAIEITEFVAIIAGAFLLHGQNWARWLAVAWIAFHVAISMFHPLRELAIHAVLLIVIAWILFRPGATRYFRNAEAT